MPAATPPDMTTLVTDALRYEMDSITSPRGLTYAGAYEVGRHSYDLLYPDADVCWDCERAFGDNNTVIIVIRSVDQEDHHPYYLHPDCWELRKINWDRPWPVPQTRVAWQTGTPTPGTATQGNIALSHKGTVTITIDGHPTVGIDTRTGTVTVCSGSEQFHIAARFAPDPQPEADAI
jgi:hypothetical protein